MLTTIAASSYASAALAFLFLSLLLLTSWRGRLHGMAITTTCLLSAGWAASLAWQAATAAPFSLLSQCMELLRGVAWCTFLFVLFKPAAGTRLLAVAKSKRFLAGITVMAVLLFLLPKLPYVLLGLTANPLARVAMAIAGMLLVEQLFRNTPPRERWGIKFACLGIGGMFAFDFYLYSDAMLFRQINPEIWAARGGVNALAAPLLAISAARNPKWSPGISVSRRVLYNSAALFGSAIYLLAMAAAGYYLRFFGGNWGSVVQAVFLSGAMLLLLAVLFSGACRAWLRVFISKHFYSYGYDYREEWMRFTRTLSRQGPELGERTIQAVADLVESPAGALYIVRESGQCELAAHWNLTPPAATESADSEFCRFLENKEWVVDLQEERTARTGDASAAIPQWLREFPRAWLVVPLLLQGKLFGFMVLAQPRSRVALNWEVLDLLKIAGSQAASYLAQQEAANALMVARQFESFNRMSTFMVHDLKNLVFQLSLLLSNAEKHKNNPAFQQDMLETVELSVQKMKLLLQKLARGISVETPASLQLEHLLRQAIAAKSSTGPKPVLEVVDSKLAVFANPARLERVIGHLIQNAIEATPKDGKVSVMLKRHDGSAVVLVSDNGAGMSEEFVREKLFKPFESTKAGGMGIGVFESREYVNELGGRLEVESMPGHGTTFRISLPLQEDERSAADMAA
ncbi:XrtA/PEP-CTERM system histidine kinase PrsK [Janthinobacterium sp. 17J80-10]|uniref:XrtA/PEP-CTERM system histidine kinase PrsK n=1 Tax=Janthinobacterium sp. 17J80-10 TaxID=2497863 RepID=UPI00100531B1|nr:XrtA/PEP-CTERM system histidine kinase PrsK [Janthinobacterium sp. 17J80-10]QAU35388.1 PEP-CTERM system histidine kinase PrsK [Janthinobacterium sp. 17J80-10]